MNNPLLDALAKPPPPPSELDELMSRDPLDLSSQDIDAIIAYHRDLRAKKAAGEVRSSRSRKGADAPTSGIDLVALVQGVKVPSAAPARAPTPTASGLVRRL